MHIYPLRLKPNQDLKQSLKQFAINNNIQAGFILTTVGSLQQATIRFANQVSSQVLNEKFEIVSLVGTVSLHGLHLHISISNKAGKTIGGHLEDGCLIYTTAEIIIGTSNDFCFERILDPDTGFKELAIMPKTE